MKYQKNNPKLTRKTRVRARIVRFSSLPILSVFRSSKHIYAQIMDTEGKTLISASDLKIKDKKTKIEKAVLVGQEIAQKAQTKKIKAVSFDRGAYKYHGRIKALCQAARDSKLTI